MKSIIGTHYGVQGIYEVYGIIRDFVEADHFDWGSFVSISKNGENVHTDTEVLNVADALNRTVMEDIEGGQRHWCGTTACFAGWAVAVHPHLLTWMPGIGLVAQEDVIRVFERINQAFPNPVSKGELFALCERDEKAFAKAYNIDPSLAYDIVYGFERVRAKVEEDGEEDEDFDPHTKEHALPHIREALIRAGYEDPELWLARQAELEATPQGS